MLRPDEFTCGSIAEAVPPSLVLPRTKYEHALLIGELDGRVNAVFLDANFEYFAIEEGSDWAGLIVGNINLEVDESALFDPNDGTGSVGALLRRGEELCLLASSARRRPDPVTLLGGLPRLPPNERVGFYKWQITLGEGLDRRLLKPVDSRPSKLEA
ncbi:MAG: hypothetical protein MI725_01990 [Pirellulales bacterium]|nr:hypothetical protein [Pirellulales bacterium]